MKRLALSFKAKLSCLESKQRTSFVSILIMLIIGSNDGKVYAFGSPQETSPTSSPTPAVPEFCAQDFVLVFAIAGASITAFAHFKPKRKSIL